MENLTILIAFSSLETIGKALPTSFIAFHTGGFGGSGRAVKKCAVSVKSAADAYAVLHHP
ncbi:hypothetical protein [uncultured Stenotrophomonas sp.]|uniref:hypothetical protein n=1 Tax=uncultured Stenotrophomonas sp. TaxID=165438 RepID=UPI0028D64729|nr:hypothetical protein [uncultured Stenotrophomonas sp.]